MRQVNQRFLKALGMDLVQAGVNIGSFFCSLETSLIRGLGRGLGFREGEEASVFEEAGWRKAILKDLEMVSEPAVWKRVAGLENISWRV